MTMAISCECTIQVGAKSALLSRRYFRPKESLAQYYALAALGMNKAHRIGLHQASTPFTHAFSALPDFEWVDAA